jgi:hypothetical protein
LFFAEKPAPLPVKLALNAKNLNPKYLSNYKNMSQALQIKATIIDIENKTDKNSNPYYRLSLQGMPGRYFYAFSFSLPPDT